MLAARVLVPSLLAACAIVACAGTDSVDIPSPTTTSSPNEPAPSDAIPRGSATAAETPDAGTADAAVDAAPVVPLCTPESEPNDSAANANAFTTCFTGVLAATSDRDYWTFTAPADATTVTFGHTESAPISYRVYEDTGFGSLFATTFTGASPAIAVTPGATYLVRLSASGAGAARTYEVTPTFE